MCRRLLTDRSVDRTARPRVWHRNALCASATEDVTALFKTLAARQTEMCGRIGFLHRVATPSCSGHVDELATEPFLFVHREHGTGYRRSWNCCDRRTRFVVIWKHFFFILSTGTRIRIDSVMRPRSSSKERSTSASVTVTVTVCKAFRIHCARLLCIS